MNESFQAILDRYAAVEHDLNDPAVSSDAKRLRERSREYKHLTPVVTAVRESLRIREQLEENRLLVADPSSDAPFKAMVWDDIHVLEVRLEEVTAQLKTLLMPHDPNDDKSCILEIRAGTGGDEAAIFVGDLFKMYQRYSEMKGWQFSAIDIAPSERGGFREIIIEIEGDGVFGALKFESGVHRVQRVPETESMGRIHTSAATVAVLPEAEEVDVEIHPADLRIDIFRSGGKGGQNVNKVETAVRIVHLPTNIVVQCQDERSQLKNREKAMKVLRSRLYDRELEIQHAAIAGARKSMVKSGDRSEKIRTYNWPQNRVTDHRLEGENKNHPLQQIVDGYLEPIVEALHVAERAAELGETA